MPRLRSQDTKEANSKTRKILEIEEGSPPKLSKYFSGSSSNEATPEKKAAPKKVSKKILGKITTPREDFNGNEPNTTRPEKSSTQQKKPSTKKPPLPRPASSRKKLVPKPEIVDVEEEYSARERSADSKTIKSNPGKTKKKAAKFPSPIKDEEVTQDKAKKLEGPSEMEHSHSESEEDEWEEVDMEGGDLGPSTSGAGDTQETGNDRMGDIEISIGSRRIKEKKDTDAETALRREINRYRKKQLEEIHKTHLLCYLAHGKFVSKACSSLSLRCMALSIIPIGFVEAREDDKFDSILMKKFLKWFQSGVLLQPGLEFNDNFDQHLRLCLDLKAAPLERDLIALLVCMLRGLGLDVRLITSVHPAVLKLPADPLLDGPASKKKKTEKPEGEKPKKKGPPPKKSIRPDSDHLPSPDYWVEVYLDSEERWIAVDPVRGCFNDPDAIESRCKPPVLYVIGFDNECAVRDLTTRYCSGYLSPSVRNMRCNHDWWAETLMKLKTKKHPLRDRLEDMQLQDLLLKQPLPTTIVELKNHPLYVLKKDIKKFEAIYPAETKKVGYVRGIEVFPRNCIHLLRAKETWLKEARLIRVGETPYKIVKARPKLGVPKEEQQDRPLHLFGFWQTEPYIPKPAVDGVIPRNQYGNVDFFKPEMLPPGTVHLPMPGLLSIAKKLEIDCAPAMVGWEFTGRGSFPVFNGWIVCEEHKETLLAAWDHCDSHQEEKRAQKRTERALENWRKMTRGLIIREKVRRKYLLTKLNVSGEGTSSQQSGDSKEDEADSSLATAWPQNKHKFTIDEYDETL